MNTKSIVINKFRSKWYLVVILVLMTVVTSYSAILNPLIISKVIDEVIPAGDYRMLTNMIILMVAISFGLLVLDILKTYIAEVFGNVITSELRKKTYDVVLEADYKSLSKFDSSQLTQRITQETGRIGQVFLVNDIIGFLSELIFMIVIFVTLFNINGIFTLFIFATFPIFYLLTKIVAKISWKINSRFYDLLEVGRSRLHVSIERIKKVKVNNATKYESELWNEWLDENAKLKRKSSVFHALNRFFMGNLMINLMYIIVILLGGFYMIEDKNMTVGTLVIFISLIPKIYGSFRGILSINVSKKVISKSFEVLDEILALPQESSGNVVNIGNIKSISFSGVDFSYGKDDFSISNINFEIKEGEKLAIIGPSGGGKSTIFDILVKLYPYSSGSVKINNTELKDINKDVVRSNISIVSQSVTLTPGRSIKENITYPLEYDAKKFKLVVEKCGLEDVIGKLKQREDTIVTNGEDNLSGGEKQRIMLASALYKDKDVLLLDEVTSALDIVTEKKIIDTLNKLSNKVIIMISHRLYNIKEFDKVILISSGKIEESGNISDLLKDSKSKLSLLMKEME